MTPELPDIIHQLQQKVGYEQSLTLSSLNRKECTDATIEMRRHTGEPKKKKNNWE